MIVRNGLQRHNYNSTLQLTRDVHEPSFFAVLTFVLQHSSQYVWNQRNWLSTQHSVWKHEEWLPTRSFRHDPLTICQLVLAAFYLKQPTEKSSSFGI